MFLEQRLWIGISFILLLSIVLAACSPVGIPAATPSDSTPVGSQAPVIERPTLAPPAESPTDTPDAVELGVQEYTNQEFGLSLSYPNGYEVQSTFSHSVVFLAPQGTQGHRERAVLSIELAADQTAEWFARQVYDDNTNLGTTITSSVMEIDGQQAYILGQLPGQDLNRQVFVVYKGILYHLIFWPDHPQEIEANQQMETLYAVIMDTLHFLPDRQGVPPVTSEYNMINQLERAVEARSTDDILRTLGDEFIVWYEMPEDLNVERYGRNEAAQTVIDNHISQAPELVFLDNVYWNGNPEQFSGLSPNENIIMVPVEGWGLEGSDEAVIFFARRGNGSLYWRGVFVPLGPPSQ